MSSQHENLSTPELLVEILRHLPAQDLERARRVNTVFSANINDTAALQRIRCLQPVLTRENQPAGLETHEFDWLGISLIPVRRKLEKLHYHVDEPIVVHPDLEVFRYFFDVRLDREELHDNRRVYITRPPITVIELRLHLCCTFRWTFKRASACILRVKNGIIFGDLVEALQGMIMSDRNYAGALRQTDSEKYHLELAAMELHIPRHP